MKVLGIDPGTRNLGWAYIELDSKKSIRRVRHGCIEASARLNFFQRLAYLDAELKKLCEQFQPQRAVIEKIFLGKSVESAFKLGHIRGICAARCSAAGAEITEIAARAVKKTITGSGNAEKQMVQRFIQQQLPLEEPLTSLDASDALALAFCGILQDSVNSKRQDLRLL